jgi:hypothetical protein
VIIALFSASKPLFYKIFLLALPLLAAARSSFEKPL